MAAAMSVIVICTTIIVCKILDARNIKDQIRKLSLQVDLHERMEAVRDHKLG
jgi:hypothetical protein